VKRKLLSKARTVFIQKTMTQLSPETVWHTSEKELLSILTAGALVPKPKNIRFYAPSFTYYKTKRVRARPNRFPTVSVTGKGCALHCKHCNGKVLETMQPAGTPEKLFELAARLKQNGALGCLVSGGCLPDGSVPLTQFIPVLEKIKHELGLTVFVHTGIIDADTAEALRSAGVDAALIDIIGSNRTIEEIYNLNVTVEDYANSLGALHEAGLTFVPHIIVGLHMGQLQGELHALKMTARYEPSALVIIAFMPIRGTVMAEVEPPQPADISKVTATARLMFPETPLALGCMRPKGKHRAETDILALQAGVNAVAFPSEEAIRYAENQGYEISFSPYCCAQIYVDKNAE
jgi:uncharacterized radical SAM superfamily protein